MTRSLRTVFPSLALTALLAACASTPSEPGLASAPARADSARWDAILAADAAVPAGSSAFELLLELEPALGSPDAHLRDDCAYGLAAAWIVRQKLLTPDELRELAGRWSANLSIGPGEHSGERGDERVLRRSFSALCLSLIAARDVATPFLDEAELQRLLERAIAYSDAERDLRDHDPALGWIHATAHTADLFKFLARNPKLAPPDLQRLLDALGRKLATPMPRAFSMGEDERIARAIVAVLLRDDHDPAGYDAFLEAQRELHQRTAEAQPFAPENFAIQQNILHTLRAVHLLLAARRDAPAHVERARAQTLDALVRP